uniref:C2H2-type domain-containing protein n=1 Tax=Angiostrongylus cantonensis TaxID=6313 RepID=A0A158P9Y6_ANGCA
MQQSKFVVVEVTTTTSTMTLIQYLITNGFDKFAVVSDLSDHPSLKYKVTSQATHSQNNVAERQSCATAQSSERNGKPRASINEIATALSRKSSPSQPKNALRTHLNGGENAKTTSALSRILESQNKASDLKQEQDRQQQEIQRIILAQAASTYQSIGESFAREHDDSNGYVNGIVDGDGVADSSDGGLGPSEEQVRASMIHLLNPVLGSAFGVSNLVFGPSTTKVSKSGSSKKHRWMTVDELEESRFGRSKSYGRVHCKATYKCALCGKPTTLNSTGSRWNLLRHVIMIHSDSKPYQCWDCDFIGIKSNVISHARQTNHRSDDAHDITTDLMRSEWNTMLHQCFPDYVKAKSRGWQAGHDEADGDLVASAIESPEIKSEELAKQDKTQYPCIRVQNIRA